MTARHGAGAVRRRPNNPMENRRRSPTLLHQAVSARSRANACKTSTSPRRRERPAQAACGLARPVHPRPPRVRSAASRLSAVRATPPRAAPYCSSPHRNTRHLPCIPPRRPLRVPADAARPPYFRRLRIPPSACLPPPRVRERAEVHFPQSHAPSPHRFSRKLRSTLQRREARSKYLVVRTTRAHHVVLSARPSPLPIFLRLSAASGPGAPKLASGRHHVPTTLGRF